MSKRPGGKMAARPLHFIWICDTSGSMQGSKITSLNFAIRETLPEMKQVAHENPNANVQMRVLTFSHGAQWHVELPTTIEDFYWQDLVADPLQHQSEADIFFLVDNSGSMHRRIESLKNGCVDFAERIMKQGTKVRLGLMGFSYGKRRNATPGSYEERRLSRYRLGHWELAEPRQFKNNIQSLQSKMFGGQGCYLANPDTVDIFPELINAFGHEPNKERIIIGISDGVGSNRGVEPIVEMLQQNSIKMHFLGKRGKFGEPSSHELLAELTGGQFWELKQWEASGSFFGLLDDAANTIGDEISKQMEDGSLSQGSDMGKAMALLADALRDDQMESRGLPPVLVLISDGQPSDDFQTALDALLAERWGQKAVRLAISIGQDADDRVLESFVSSSTIPVLKANNADSLINYIRFVSTAVLKSSSQPTQGDMAHSFITAQEKVGSPQIPEVQSEEIEVSEEVW
jgi:uncharacterized protein YegL